MYSLAYAQGPKSLVLHAAGTTGNGAVFVTTGYSIVTVAVAGVAAGADLQVQFEGSLDGTNYTAIKCREITANTLATTSTASGTTLTQWSCPVAGLQKFRTPVSGGSVGAINVSASALPQVSWIPPASAAGGGSGDALVSDPLSQFASTTSAQLATVLSNETGTGLAVFNTSPTLVTPLLGTPTSGTLTNTTGFPIANLAGAGAGVLTLLATPTSANLAAAITNETGSGALVFGTSPTMVTPVLGAATATSVNLVTITAPATTAILTLAEGVTLSATASIRLRGTGTTASSATPTINTDVIRYYTITAQTVDITSFTTNLSGTPQEGDTLWISITGTAARAVTFGASFESSTVALPTTTVTTNRLDIGFIWNAVSGKWRCIAVA